MVGLKAREHPVIFLDGREKAKNPGQTRRKDTIVTTAISGVHV